MTDHKVTDSELVVGIILLSWMVMSLLSELHAYCLRTANREKSKEDMYKLCLENPNNIKYVPAKYNTRELHNYMWNNIQHKLPDKMIEFNRFDFVKYCMYAQKAGIEVKWDYTFVLDDEIRKKMTEKGYK
jgi:hypothetical protein